MNYYILAFLWILWCFMHSLLITPKMVGYLHNRYGERYKFARLCYNLFAIATLLPISLYGRSLTGPVLFSWDGVLTPFRWLLLLIAIFLFLAGAKNYNLLQFLGIKQIITGDTSLTLDETGALNQSGILSVTRHPWYLGGILLLWSYFIEMRPAELLTSTILSIYLVIGSILEESKLKKEFGDAYRLYRQEVSMIFPTKWIVKRVLAIIRPK